MQFITWLDYLLLPVFIFFIYRVGYLICNKYYPAGHPWRKYFLYGLGLKITGAIFIGLIYQYYYKGGDTAYYFYHAEIINSSLSDSFTKWINLIFHIPDAYNGDYFNYTYKMEWYNDKSSYMICCITAFFGIFTLNTYLPTSILFAFLSFSGGWAMFRTFAQQYPSLIRYIAIAMLFIPSCLIWGSGIFKDTICMFALGWMLFSSFQLLIQRNMSLKNIVILIISFYILLVIKVYILISFLPALALWILFYYSHKIKPVFIRFFAKILVVVAALVMFGAVYVNYSSSLGKYSLDQIAKTSLVTRDWIAYSSGDQGSSYDLGEFEPNIQGLISKFPQAVNVTLFRPYLWEANKSLVFLNALEALVFLFLTLKILFTIGPVKIWKSISSDPNIQFCLIFSIVFAFSVGVSTYNFGALSRYKIPCLPLYLLALVLIYYKHNPPSKKFFL
ncbi:MAG: hypothetical protein WC716_13110 [Chitinophagaceae bacterium]|jgi:hypothetical protein